MYISHVLAKDVSWERLVAQLALLSRLVWTCSVAALPLDRDIFRRIVQLLLDGLEARIDGRRAGECGGRRAAASRLRQRLGRGRRHRDSRVHPENVLRPRRFWKWFVDESTGWVFTNVKTE